MYMMKKGWNTKERIPDANSSAAEMDLLVRRVGRISGRETGSVDLDSPARPCFWIKGFDLCRNGTTVSGENGI